MFNKFQPMKNYSADTLRQNLKLLGEPEPIPSVSQALTSDEWMALAMSHESYIRKLKESMKQFGDSFAMKQLDLKTKLEDEIAQNEKAVKAFADVTESIIGMITKISKACPSQKASVKSSGDYRESITQSLKQNHGNHDEEFQQQSEFSCIDEIVNETDKLLSYLSSLIQQLIQSRLMPKQGPNQKGILEAQKVREDTKQRQTIKSKDTGTETSDFFIENKHETKASSQGTIKQVQSKKREAQEIIINRDEEIKVLQVELNRKVLECKDLERLLEQQEQTKNKILLSIYNAISQDMLKEMEQMTREELIEHIKKRNYRVKELEKDKRQLITRSKLERETDQQRFMDLLQEIKKVKKMHHSMSLT